MNNSATRFLAQLKGLDIRSLEPLQRVLLVTDGTLTEILEAAFLERIQLVKVLHQVVSPASSHEYLERKDDEAVIQRRVLLRGERSHRNYVYAESLIAIDRLEPAFRQDLVESNVPLGRLWLEHKLETYKEMIQVRSQNAGELSRYFECSDAALLLIRTYRVFSAGKPVMIISEHFPASYSNAVPQSNSARQLPPSHSRSDIQ